MIDDDLPIGTVTIDDVRPEVIQFAVAMEKVLRRNDYKGGWVDCSYAYLITCLEDEVKELRSAYCKRRDVFSTMHEEAIDVANFAMMIYDKWNHDLDAWLNAPRDAER